MIITETAGQRAYAVVRLNENLDFYELTCWIAICWQTYQWLLTTETTKASFPIVFETILVFNSMTDFTLGGSGSIQLDWFRTTGYTNSHIIFPSSERKRTIAIGK